MVWRSQDPLLRRSVAVKLIHPRLAEDPGFARALAEEARRVAGLAVFIASAAALRIEEVDLVRRQVAARWR